MAHKGLEEGKLPDLQVHFRKQNARALSDDSEVNFFVRGKYISKILNACCAKNAAKCLELCCGTGSLALEAARRGADVTGIDISSEAIQIGQQYQGKILKHLTSGKVNLFVGDLNRIKLPQREYDSVFVWDGLHHINNIDHLVSEVYKTLKDNAVFAVHDHVSPSTSKWKIIFATVTSEFLLLILPTSDDFSTKIKPALSFIIKKLKRQSTKRKRTKEVLTSPFEDVSGENIINTIRGTFKITELKRYSGGISHRVAARLRPDCRCKFGLIRFVCTLDTLLISLRILKPEYFFLIAHKKEEIHNSRLLQATSRA
jgi:ubiquinone/menaquinone biosynthesis C-methylase UbiE